MASPRLSVGHAAERDGRDVQASFTEFDVAHCKSFLSLFDVGVSSQSDSEQKFLRGDASPVNVKAGEDMRFQRFAFKFFCQSPVNGSANLCAHDFVHIMHVEIHNLAPSNSI